MNDRVVCVRHLSFHSSTLEAKSSASQAQGQRIFPPLNKGGYDSVKLLSVRGFM